MPFSAEDWAAIALTLRLAATTTVLLLVLCTPIAWWLATTRSRWRGPVGAIVALPLVLPPTVVGFYLLVTMGPVSYTHLTLPKIPHVLIVGDAVS